MTELANRLARIKAQTNLRPLFVMPQPEQAEAEDMIVATVLRIAQEKGIEPDEVKIPLAIPACFGFFEDIDPACKNCFYAEHCCPWNAKVKPSCFKMGYSSQAPACSSCILADWCREEIQP